MSKETDKIVQKLSWHKLMRLRSEKNKIRIEGELYFFKYHRILGKTYFVLLNKQGKIIKVRKPFKKINEGWA